MNLPARSPDPGRGPRGTGEDGVITVETGLQHYLKQINELPLLTADEEKQLARQIEAGVRATERFAQGVLSLPEKERIEQDAIEARERMIRSNLRLVVNIAKAYTGRGMPFSDLIEEGNLGLLRAVEGFDPDIGSRFSTYASWWIKQAIKRALINAVQPVHIPAYMVEMIARWKQAISELQEKLGRVPTIQEISDRLQLPERKLKIIKRAVRAFSAPTQAPAAEAGATLFDMLPDEKTPAPEDLIFNQAESQVLEKLLGELTDREAEILRLRYGLEENEPMTLKDIGQKVGLTRERVRQIETEALRKLHAILSDTV